MSQQLIARVPDDLAADVDALIAEGVAASRSELIRELLADLVARHRRAAEDAAIRDAYTRMPQSDDDDLAWVTEDIDGSFAALDVEEARGAG